MNLSAHLAWMTELDDSPPPVDLPRRVAQDAPLAPVAAPAAGAARMPPRAPTLRGGALGIFQCPAMRAPIALATCESTRAAGKLKACGECRARPGAVPDGGR